MKIRQLIVQDSEFSCGEACVAMVLGLPSAQTARFVMMREKETERGIYGDELLYLFWAQGIPCFGFVPKHERYSRDMITRDWDELYLPTEHVVSTHLKDGLGIVVLPSLGAQGEFHCVAVDHGIVYDPEQNVSARRTDFNEVLRNMTSVFLIGLQGFGV